MWMRIRIWDPGSGNLFDHGSGNLFDLGSGNLFDYGSGMEKIRIRIRDKRPESATVLETYE
jgi:hypothetical protein